MDNQDKENVRAKTRIPIPLAPLPALPKHLLMRSSKRPALNTLSGPDVPNHKVPSANLFCMAGPSEQSKSVDNRQNKFVTARGNSGELDATFVVYRDSSRRNSEPSVIIISDDDDDDNEIYFPANDGTDDTEQISASSSGQVRVSRGNNRRISEPSIIITDETGEEIDEKEKDIYFLAIDSFAIKHISASCSDLNMLVPDSVENINSSLMKRPHSTELRQLTPLRNRNRSGDRVNRRLNFNQAVQERMQSAQQYMDSLDTEYADDILSNLIEAEKKPGFPLVVSETRACLINGLMKINGMDGDPAMIQTAVWYMDAALASGKFSRGCKQLVATASYWLASKLHGLFIRASEMVDNADYSDSFTPEDLLEAEKEVFRKLKFPSQPVVPQDYIYYFAWWCSKERPGEIEVASTFICLCGMMVDQSLCDEYPSVIAAAAVRTALLLLKKTELILLLKDCPAYIAAKEKATNISTTCTFLREALCVMGGEDYPHKFLLDQYGAAPNIAQTLLSEAYKLAVFI